MVEVFNLSALVLRNCAKKLFQVFILILFFGSVFILLGKQLYKGVLTQKCVLLPSINISNEDYAAFVSNSSNWLEDKNGYYLCGNSTGSRSCPLNYTCLKGADANSYTSNFNFYGSSVVTISQLMTLHFWQELYQRMLLTAGTLHVTYFVLAFYSFLYSSGLILAIITRTYKNILKEFEIIEKASCLVDKDSATRCDTSKEIIRSPSCKSYELFSSQVINNDRIERQTAENAESASQSTGKSLDSDRALKEHVIESKNQREAIRNQLANEESNDSSSETCAQRYGNPKWFTSCQKTLHSFVSCFAAELFFMLSISLYLCIIVLHLSQVKANLTEISKLAYNIFAGISLIEVVLKLIAFGPREYFQNKWNAFDCVVLIIGGTEMTVLEVENPMLFILRGYKLVKLFICCNTCVYLKYVTGSILFMFRHPTSVLLIFITICVVIGMQLYGVEYFHTDRFPGQEPPRWFFKDCYSSFILVFCMLCGDWKQPMVNTVLFTSCASDLLMLIFVLIGNLVVMNLFLGVVFFHFFYKIVPISSYINNKKLQNTFQTILSRQKAVQDTQITNKESKSKDASTSDGISSGILSMQETSSHSLKKEKQSRSLQTSREMEIIEDNNSEYMADCCPSLCYFCCSFCKADENPVLWQNWAEVRCRLYCFVETKLFRITVSLVIIASIALLVIDRSYGSNAEITKVINRVDPCIFVLFMLEMSLKWMAYGLQKFFKSHLGRLEFFIVLVYLVDLLSIKFFDGQKNIFKALRAFRLLSLTPLLQSYQESEPLPLKRNSCVAGSENASRESLLHVRPFECNQFLNRHCRYRPSGSGEIFQMDWNATEIHPSDVNGSRVRRVELKNVADFRDNHPTIEAEDCLPAVCYRIFHWCKRDVSFFNFWTKIRTKIVILVTNKYFFGFVAVIILISSFKLAVEANFSKDKPAVVEKIASYSDRILAAFFMFEMLLKLFGFGFKGYFTSPWCIIEFFIMATSAAYVILYELEVGNFPVLKIIRILRILYICEALNFNKQAQFVLTSLKRAIPSFFSIFLFIFYLWLIFAILCVTMFAQKLFQCVDKNDNPLPALTHSNCLSNNMTYKNSPVNFDSIGNAYVALLQVATLQNWISFVSIIMDNSVGVGQTKYELYTAIFFPLFIMFGTFLTVNFFVGVICCYFKDLKKESEKSPNAGAKKLYTVAVRKMESTKLGKTIPIPKIPFQAFVYRMVISDNFEIAGFVFIGLHMLLIALDMYEPDPSEMFALAMTELNIFFIVIFCVECIMKIIAFRQYYFLSLWNHFDVLVLALCICGALFEELFSSPMLPAMLRLARFLKCRRYLRRHARGMLPLMYSLYCSIPAFFSLVIMQFLIMFIYAIFGVHFFHDIRQTWDISGELSFETFPKAMLLLFQLSTLAGWMDVLLSLSDVSYDPMSAVIFVVSYIIIAYYIVIKTHLIIILDSYENAMYEYENILLKEDYEMFAEVWQKFDVNARGIIKFSNLPDLLDVMEEPFHFGKPNRFLIATLNIPIYDGDVVFYVDVMDALTRDFMSHKAHLLEATDNFPSLLDNKGKTLKKTGSSLWRQRQHHCAYVIQKAWRYYTGRLAQSPVFYSEVRLASQGDKVDTFLAAEIRSGSHASV